jgi:toxin ParE1/3/4
MPRLRLTAAATRDLDLIQDRGVEHFGVKATRAHMEGFQRVFGLLRRYPAVGQAKTEYGEGVRVFSHRPHRVIYHVDEQEILILRILHSAMDADAAVGGRS